MTSSRIEEAPSSAACLESSAPCHEGSVGGPHVAVTRTEQGWSPSQGGASGFRTDSSRRVSEASEGASTSTRQPSAAAAPPAGGGEQRAPHGGDEGRERSARAHGSLPSIHGSASGRAARREELSEELSASAQQEILAGGAQWCLALLAARWSAKAARAAGKSMRPEPAAAKAACRAKCSGRSSKALWAACVATDFAMVRMRGAKCVETSTKEHPGGRGRMNPR
mmetsp:Transcript_43283/g.124951  ORF Transcript_43283/g.124951 Transcript_43283/m.124951 type:complete len:224 (-) Transcript_43283:198-869(-)